jgi:hypothetical protein
MARLSTNYQALLRAYCESPRINSVSLEAEALYIRLLCLSDGEGRYYADPFTICARAMTDRFKAGLTVNEVAGWIDQLEEAGLIEKYQHAGDTFLLINRYHDAGNRGKVSFPPPPSPAGGQSGTGGTEVPSFTSISINTNNSTSISMSDDCGEPVENEASEDAASGGSKDDAKAKANELLFRYLVPLGLGHAAIPEAVEIIAGPDWLGSGLTDDTVIDAVKAVAMRCRGGNSPGALALSILRSETASVAASATPVVQGDSGHPGDSAPNSGPATEPEAKATHHERYAAQLEDEATTREEGHPDEAATLRLKAEQHRAAARTLRMAAAKG